MNYYEIQNQNNKSKNYNDYAMINYAAEYSNYGLFMNEVPINKENGFLELYITKDLGKTLAVGAVVIIYVNQGNNQIPVKSIIVSGNPTIIDLPVAHPLGTLIESPEYFFTPYDLSIEKEGYYKIRTLNIRMFPKVGIEFYYNLNKIIQGESDKEKKIKLPPHPRDTLVN